MYRIDFIPIHVKCPGSPFRKIVPMEIRMLRSEDRNIPAPCNGCEDMNGMMPCMECCRAITTMFFEHPDMDVQTAVDPIPLMRKDHPAPDDIPH